MKKRHPSLYLKQDSVFDADLESTLIDFVLVYENNTKKKKVSSETSVTNTSSNGDEKEAKSTRSKRKNYRTNYFNNLMTNGLKLYFRVGNFN